MEGILAHKELMESVSNLEDDLHSLKNTTDADSERLYPALCYRVTRKTILVESLRRLALIRAILCFLQNKEVRKYFEINY